jgi:hypothetical protein
MNQRHQAASERAETPEEQRIREIHAILEPVALHFRRELSSSDLGFWSTAMAMHEVPLQTMKAAMFLIMARDKFFPQPAAVAELAKGESALNRPLRAWDQLNELVRRIGPYALPPTIEDPALQQTITDYGGWFRVCEELVDDAFYKRDWMRIYENNLRALPLLGSSNQLMFTPSSLAQLEEGEQMTLLPNSP